MIASKALPRSAQEMEMQIRLTHQLRRTPLAIMPIGARNFRDATAAEVLHFQTCNAAGPYSAINPQVPAQVPVWQYVDPQERAAARKYTGAAQ